MGVSLVLRGEDHLTNTPRQILLLKTLGLPVPEYAHIALVVGSDGAPLSKRTGSRSVQELREQGFLPLAVNNYLARLGHTYESNAFMGLTVWRLRSTRRACTRHRRVSTRRSFCTGSAKRCARRMSPPCGPGWRRRWVALVPDAERTAFVEAVRGNVVFPTDARHWAQAIYAETLGMNHAAHEAAQSAGEEFFDITRRALEKHGTDFKALSQMVKQDTGLSGKTLFQPLRAALTGELDGPEMAKLLPLIGLDRAHRRIERILGEMQGA